jgi:hypothetical protein
MYVSSERALDQLRCMMCCMLCLMIPVVVITCGPITRARGSAYVEMGSTKVFAAWYPVLSVMFIDVVLLTLISCCCVSVECGIEPLLPPLRFF